MAASGDGKGGMAVLPRTVELRGKSGMVLRTPTAEDDAALRDIFSDPITMKHLPVFHKDGGWTMEDMAARREAWAEEQLQSTRMAVCIFLPARKGGSEKEGNEEELVLAGTTGFARMDLVKRTSEMGIILHRPFWRRGVATEAMYLCLFYGFEKIGLDRVDWYTAANNEDMCGWCEKVLHLKSFKIQVDAFEESVGYSLHRSEWYGAVSHLLQQKISK